MPNNNLVRPSKVESELINALLEKLLSHLPSDWGIMTWIYNRVGSDLDVQLFAPDRQTTSETLRLVRAVASALVRQEAREGGTSHERWFRTPLSGEPSSQQLISSASVVQIGGHDHMRVWSHGGLAGELVLNAGDGARVAMFMLMLVEDTQR